MEPPVLGWVFADKLLDGSGVLAGNPQEGVILIRPFVREDNAIDAHLEIETIVDSSTISYYYWEIVCNGQQAYAFIGAGLTAKEINEYSLLAGILVSDKT